MLKKSKLKEDKPVNISISFNINPKQIVKETPYAKTTKNIDNEIKCRKINNHQIIKTHRNSSTINQYSYVPFSLKRKPVQLNQRIEDNVTTDRKALFVSQQPEEMKVRRKIKRQSMDGLFQLKKKPDTQVLYISCQEEKTDKTAEKVQVLKPKLTPISSKRKGLKLNKPLKPNLNISIPQGNSTKSDVLKTGKMQTHILKNVMLNSARDNNSKINIENLKKMISKLVSQEVKRQQNQQSKFFKNKPKISNTINGFSSQKGSKSKLHNQNNKSKNKTHRVHNRSTQLVKKKSKTKLEQQYKIKDKINQQISQDIAIKLNSFKSINGSLLASQISDGQCLNISQNNNNNNINILKTSVSNAQLQALVRHKYNNKQSEYENKQATSEQQISVLKIQRYWRQYRTRKLVSTYIHLLNNNFSRQQYLMNELQKYKNQVQKSIQIDQFKNTQQKPIQIVDQQIRQKQANSHPIRTPITNSFNQNSNIKQFHSYQIPKQQQLQRVTDFKRKQISKWQQTLLFIQKNLNQNNMKNVLLQVLHQLETNKNNLQKQIGVESKDQKTKRIIDQNINNKTDLVSFTNPLKSKQQEDVQNDLNQQDSSIYQLRQSYMGNDLNQDLKVINFSNIQSALNNKKKNLQQKHRKELQTLENQLQSGKINAQAYEKQKNRLQLWLQHQQKQIIRARKQIQSGYQQIKKVIQKNKKDQIFLNRIQKNTDLKRCLSDDYIKHLPIQKVNQITANVINNTNKKLNQFNKQKQTIDNGNLEQQQLQQQQVPSEQQDEEQQDQNLQSLSTNKLKQRLKNLNSLNQDRQSPQISYQSVSKQYEQSLEEQQQQHIIRNQLALLSKQNQNQKLKKLQNTDKQDIFQFVFLDICIQFCQQVYCHPDKLRKVVEYITLKKKPPQKKFKGIKTNINVVKDYLKSFLAFMNRTSKQTIQRITIPMGPSALQMLKYMHFYEEEQNDQQQEDLIGTLILPTSLFESFQNNLLAGLQFQPYYDDQQKQQNRIQFLKGVIHIHNKAIFDALNQSLDLERPFGIWGKPFPWKNVPEFNHQMTYQQKQAKFKTSSQRVIQYCTYVCGIIIDKQQSLVAPSLRLSNDYIQQIKQDRLSKMLANDLIQNEQRWVFYDDEETQVMVELSYLIYELLTKQVAQQIAKIGSNRILEASFQMLTE